MQCIQLHCTMNQDVFKNNNIPYEEIDVSDILIPNELRKY